MKCLYATTLFVVSSLFTVQAQVTLNDIFSIANKIEQRKNLTKQDTSKLQTLINGNHNFFSQKTKNGLQKMIDAKKKNNETCSPTKQKTIAAELKQLAKYQYPEDFFKIEIEQATYQNIAQIIDDYTNTLCTRYEHARNKVFDYKVLEVIIQYGMDDILDFVLQQGKILKENLIKNNTIQKLTEHEDRALSSEFVWFSHSDFQSCRELLENFLRT